MSETTRAPSSPEVQGAGGATSGLGRIESPEQVIVIVALVALTVAIVWGVLSRYVVSNPATWVEEVARLAFAWLIFVGAAEVHRRRYHLGVDIVTAMLPLRIQRVLGLALEVVVACFCVYAAYLGARQAIASVGSHTSMLRLPLWINYAAVTVGLGLMAFRSLQYLLRNFASRRQA